MMEKCGLWGLKPSSGLKERGDYFQAARERAGGSASSLPALPAEQPPARPDPQGSRF